MRAPGWPQRDPKVKCSLIIMALYEVGRNVLHYASANQTGDTMPDQLEIQVIAAEERLRLAMLFSDVPALDALLSPELHFTDHFGHVITKADDLAFHRSGVLRLIDLSPAEQHLQLVPGGAVVSVLMHLLGSYQGQPINQLIRYTRVWALAPDGALQVIAGHASELRLAPAAVKPPEADLPPAGSLGLRVTGCVMWAASPVAGARIHLKEDGNFYELPSLAETVTGADGWFVLENPPAGQWMLYAVAPSDEYWSWSGHSISIGVGQAVRSSRFELAKKFELLAPEIGAALPSDSVTLRWESFPDTVRYHVDVFNNETGEAVLRQDTPETTLLVAPALAPGLFYQWSVHALNFAQQQIAYSSSGIFRTTARIRSDSAL